MSRIGYCLEPHDLAIAKLVAWREKDVNFLKVMADYSLIEKGRLIVLAKDTPLKSITVDELLRRIDVVCQESKPGPS